MKSKILFMCAVAIISLGLLACTPTEKIDVSYDDFMGDNHISKTLTVSAGDSFTVTLFTNPTTGFDWEEAEISAQTVLEEEDREYIPPEGEGIVGAGGKTTWTFKALEKGTVEVTIDYSQAWEGGEKGIWTFDITVVVK